MAIILERNEIISPKSANLWRSTRLQPADRGGADNLQDQSVIVQKRVLRPATWWRCK